MHFSQARTRSTKGYALPPEDIVTGDILVRGNLFENTVQNATDGGGLQFWGATADHTDTFRDVLVIGNVEFDPENPDLPPIIDVGPRDGGTGEAGASWPIPSAGDSGWPTSSGGGDSGGCGCALGGRPEGRRSGGWWLAALAMALGARATSRGGSSARK